MTNDKPCPCCKEMGAEITDIIREVINEGNRTPVEMEAEITKRVTDLFPSSNFQLSLTRQEATC